MLRPLRLGNRLLRKEVGSLEPLDTLRAGKPVIFVIFGITGNLAQKRLLPALYHLIKDDLLHEQTRIIGLSRKQLDTDEMLGSVELCVLEADKTCDPLALKKFRKRLSLMQFDPMVAADYRQLRTQLQAIEDKEGVCMDRVFYLSIPPQVYAPIIEQLGTNRLNAGCRHHRAVSRLLVEKPFGYDLTSARELIQQTAQHFTEEQVFRIDHYLAKETAQNILIFRDYNPVFDGLWDRRHISAIDLTFAESIGVEGRAEFYDNVGALRDVVQNHLLQLLVLTTMEVPQQLTSQHIHAAKRTLLKHIPAADPYRYPVIRGQYDGYAQEVHNPGSNTETFVRLHLEIADRRWRGVPITMTAGKALAAKRTEIAVTFYDAEQTRAMNRLIFHIQPDEGIDVTLTVKKPGFKAATETAKMSFSYASAFGDPNHPDAYERVLVDAVKGDRTLFATSDEVLESWRILEPVLKYWGQERDKLHHYRVGSEGPSQSSNESI